DASCVSRSTQSGSSVKNFGTAADPSIVVAATAATVPRMAAEMRFMVVMMMSPGLEAGAEREHQTVAFTRARDLDARHRADRCVERCADAVRGRETAQIDVSEARGDRACVDKQRH